MFLMIAVLYYPHNQLVVRYKPGPTPKEDNYGANKGISWVILTNGVEWKLYKIRFEQPINHDIVATINFLAISHKSEKDLDVLFLLSKEGLAKNARDDYYDMIQSVNRYVIGNLLLTSDVLNCIRKELKKLADGLRVEESEIERIIRNEVIKREIFEGDESTRAQQKIAKSQKKQIKKATPTTEVIESAQPSEPAVIPSITEQLLSESNKQESTTATPTL